MSAFSSKSNSVILLMDISCKLLPVCINNLRSIAAFKYLLNVSKAIPNLLACLRLLSLRNTTLFFCLTLISRQKANRRCVVSVDSTQRKIPLVLVEPKGIYSIFFCGAA